MLLLNWQPHRVQNTITLSHHEDAAISSTTPFGSVNETRLLYNDTVEHASYNVA